MGDPEAAAGGRRAPHRDATVVGLAAIVILMSTLLAGTEVPPERALTTWSARDGRLPPASTECVVRELGRGVLRGIPDPDGELAQHLLRSGFDAVPLDRRELVGETVLACALYPGGPP